MNSNLCMCVDHEFQNLKKWNIFLGKGWVGGLNGVKRGKGWRKGWGEGEGGTDSRQQHGEWDGTGKVKGLQDWPRVLFVGFQVVFGHWQCAGASEPLLFPSKFPIFPLWSICACCLSINLRWWQFPPPPPPYLASLGEPVALNCASGNEQSCWTHQECTRLVCQENRSQA